MNPSNESRPSTAPADAPQPAAAPVRKRPPPGERRLQILQALAQMLQEPQGERITTATLAAKVDVSEAALYRHFASKAQMFEGLIEFIESTVFSLANQIATREVDAKHKALLIAAMVLQFADKNPGMARVMVGDALVLENDRLQQRITLFFDKLESLLRQLLRQHKLDTHSEAPTHEAQILAATAMAYVLGRIHRLVRSGFQQAARTDAEAALSLILR